MTFGRSKIVCLRQSVHYVCAGISLSLLLTGCAGNNAKAKQEQLKRAYNAGVEAGKVQAQQQMQQAGNRVPQVTFLGHVENPAVVWSEGLTLAKALVEAGYKDQNAPSSITIYRNGEPMRVDLQSLLGGEDYPLFPGDTIVIQN